jgi:predicted amidohydrolase YtcJ
MRKRKLFLFHTVSIILLLLLGCTEEKGEKADLILENGTIITLSENTKNTEAIAVKSDTIMAVGSLQEVNALKGDTTKVIDLQGATAIPGLFDSHLHFISLGESTMQLNLSDERNWDEIVLSVAQVAREVPRGEWIVGRGWHQEKWDPEPEKNVEGYPLHDDLSNATPYNPVYLIHASGHAVFANKRAMELAGIDDSTKAPEGGRIVRDSLGNAIGVFEEEASELISSAMEKSKKNLSEEERIAKKRRAIEAASEECLKNGITSVYDASSSFNDINLFKEMVDSDKIGPRLNVMIYEKNYKLRDKIEDYKIVNYKNNSLNVRGIKRFIDGALGSRGAWMLEEYNDLEGHTGINTTPLDTLRETAEIAIENGLQLCTHAIGDKANRIILDIYENTFNEYSDKEDLRWRVEHAQHLALSDIPRFGKLDVITSMQGIHCTSDAIFVKERLGSERAKRGAYVWRKLIDSGATICNGTDAPVEDVDPIANFYASVTRRLPDGTTFYPSQSMTRMEALRSYTINGAYASFQEDKIGTLEKGKLADITVLSKNLLEVPEEQIKDTDVLYTIVGGKILYQKGN